MPVEKWRCDECGQVFPSDKIASLFVDHPKPGCDKVEISQCPECGSVNLFTALCDEPGCEREVTSGWPTNSGGYRNTCYNHRIANENQWKGK